MLGQCVKSRAYASYHGAEAQMSKRESIQQRRVQELESEFRLLLPRILKQCALVVRVYSVSMIISKKAGIFTGPKLSS
jgi:hypothetical protein